MPVIRVLVVDDSALMRRSIAEMLRSAGMQVEVARNGLEALERAAADPPDVLTLDINMPEMDGMTCLSRLMVENPLPVVMVSSLTSAEARLTLEALELGAVDYVPKPGGTVSLGIAEIEEQLVLKVRAAAGARVRRSGNLLERIRRQNGEGAGPAASSGSASSGSVRSAASGFVPRSRSRPGTEATEAVEPAGRERGSVDLLLIGSSTGGPTALTSVLSRLPATFAAPVVIAQHLPASFTSHLAKRLDGECAIAVREVQGTAKLEPGVVYLARGDADVVVGSSADGLTARSVPASAEHRWHPSVDRLVASALNVLDAARLGAVLLTGMGDDGAEQMARVHAGGGRTIAESESTAVVFGMPGELVKRGGAGAVLPLDEIGRRVARWAIGPRETSHEHRHDRRRLRDDPDERPDDPGEKRIRGDDRRERQRRTAETR